jgi:3-hydroxybutyryl-CoA dehydratase
MRPVKSSSETWTAGRELPSLSKALTQEKIDGYARASGDFNPIHVDPAFAAATPFGGTIAHGMLLLAYLSEMLTAAFGRAWLSGGRLKVRFKGVARPGDTLTVRGKVGRVQEEGRRSDGRPSGRLFAAVECVNQAGELLVTGDAEVRLDG